MKNDRERYQNYLPIVVKEAEVFQEIARVESSILREEELAMKALEQDQWIWTATRKGLARRAKMMGIPFDEKQDLEQSRQHILFQWNKHGPYTFGNLLEWLNGFCGKENYTARMLYGEYKLSILLRLRKKNLLKEITDTLRKMIPANLLLMVWIDCNKYGQFKVKTYGALNQMARSYSALQQEELTLS